MLQERFREFARDTGNIGQERVDTVNHMADELINSGHSDAATIAEWKDGLNEAWADLLELIDTRTQILAASYELHKFYHDAKEILGRIQDKHKKLPEELGRDQNTVETLQRMHTTFEHDIQALGTQVCSKWMALSVGIGTWAAEFCCSSWPLCDWDTVLPAAFQVYFCGNNFTCTIILSVCLLHCHCIRLISFSKIEIHKYTDFSICSLLLNVIAFPVLGWRRNHKGRELLYWFKIKQKAVMSPDSLSLPCA